MNIFKKVALFTIFACLTVGYTPPIFSAASSSSSSSSSSSGALDVDTIHCNISETILNDPLKIEKCLEIWHLRKLTIDAVVNEAHCLNQSIEKESLQATSSINLSPDIDHEKSKKFEKESIQFFEAEQIAYSEADEDVKNFIDEQELIASNTLPPVKSLRLQLIEKNATFPIYENIAKLLSAKLHSRNKFFDTELLQLKLQQNDWPQLSIAMVLYTAHISSQYYALREKINPEHQLPFTIFPFYARTFAPQTREKIITLLHQKQVLYVINLLEPVVKKEINDLKKINTARAHLKKKHLESLPGKIETIKRTLTLESIYAQAEHEFAGKVFFNDLINILDNDIVTQIEMYHDVLPLGKQQSQQPSTPTNFLSKYTLALRLILINPGEFDTVLQLQALQLPTRKPSIPALKDKQQIAQKDSKKNKRKQKGNAQHQHIAQNLADDFTLLNLTDTKPVRAYHESEVEPENDIKIKPIAFEVTHAAPSEQDNDWLEIGESEETDQEQEPTEQEIDQPLTDTKFIETKNIIGLLDIERTQQDGHENAIFIYKSFGKQKTNPLLGVKRDPRTYKKSANPFDNNHAFTRLVEQHGAFARLDKYEKMPNSQCKCFYSLPGRIAATGYPVERAQEMGPNGYFEFIIVKDYPQQQGGRCIHRFFRPGQTAFPGLLTEEALA